MSSTPGRTAIRWALALVLLIAFLWLTLTSPDPLGPPLPAPNADQVGAGRAAYRQLREARGAAGRPVILGPAQLDGIGALASHGFRPDQLRVGTDKGSLTILASHRLPFGRWLNLTATAYGPSKGFPAARLKVGIYSLPPTLSRWAIDLGRWLLRLRRVDLPPLDRLVRNFSVNHGFVSATIALPKRSGLVDQMAGAVALPVDTGQVVQIYCALTAEQRAKPSGDFAEQVRRAFAISPAGAQANFNRSAFLALGMLLVDPRVADFADSAREQLQRCTIPIVPTSIYNRGDWPKHWTLSAAIAAGAGVQLSEAVGEWKELADSLARQSEFAVGDPSGFSMADLAADRAGFSAARAAVDPDRAEAVARRLASATPEQLLPKPVVEREDGLTNAEFVRRYGGVDDPRFAARVAEIDAALDQAGIR